MLCSSSPPLHGHGSDCTQAAAHSKLRLGPDGVFVLDKPQELFPKEEDDFSLISTETEEDEDEEEEADGFPAYKGGIAKTSVLAAGTKLGAQIREMLERRGSETVMDTLPGVDGTPGEGKSAFTFRRMSLDFGRGVSIGGFHGDMMNHRNDSTEDLSELSLDEYGVLFLLFFFLLKLLPISCPSHG